MSCEEVQTQLTALLDGELASEAVVVIEAHLAGCARCTETRAEISAVLEMTKAWSVEEGSGGLAEIQQLIHQDEIHSLLQEMKRLRGEVASLRAEVAELRRGAARRDAALEREISVLRFPRGTFRDAPRPIL